MSIDAADINDGTQEGACHLLARGAADDVCADRRLRAAIDDYFVPPESRLDDRLRAALDAVLAVTIGTVEGELRQYAARLLAGRGAPDAAARLATGQPVVLDVLVRTGILRDGGLVSELAARVRQDLIGDALPSNAQEPDRPSLLVRLASGPDMIIAAAASAMMAAEARRRGMADPANVARSDLPAELHHQLVWRTAAVLRDQVRGEPEVDRALSDAALRSLAAHDEGERLEAAAARLGTAIGAQPTELQAYLIEAIGDRRIALFIALLAQAMGFGYDLTRDIVLDPVADRLWLVLRAVKLERPAIATIGLALCEADPRRDVDAFADRLDAIMAVDPAAARDALATLGLHPDFRRAIIEIARARGQ